MKSCSVMMCNLSSLSWISNLVALLNRVGSFWASQVVLVVKNLPANAEDQEFQVQSLGQEDPLEEGTATHSNILAWRIL